MEGERVRLTVMGLSYNPVHDGAYALILAEMNGPFRIPVIIGAAEAQSIAVILERVVTPRPLTHDLFTSLGHAFGIRLKEIDIYSFEDGIFSANMTFENREGETVEIDSRTSDAIAIAIRANAPIYTTREIMESTGFILEKRGPGKGVASGHNSDGESIEIEWNEDDSNEFPAETQIEIMRLEDTPVELLEEMLADAVATENYELAKEIKKIIEKLNNK